MIPAGQKNALGASAVACRRANLRFAGFTLIELLIAGTVVVVVLGMAGAFLGQQSQLQRSVQARSEAQDKARVVLQIVTQDLSLAGNRVIVDSVGRVEELNGELCGDGRCVVIANVDGVSTLSTRYLTSQVPSAEGRCRQVDYELSVDSQLLSRSDVPCGDTPIMFPFASGVQAFRVLMLCSGDLDGDGNIDVVTDFPLTGITQSCPGGYGRSAMVSFAGASDITVSRGATGAAVEVVGARPGETQSVACPTGRICYAMTQEVLLPNLKDN